MIAITRVLTVARSNHACPCTAHCDAPAARAAVEASRLERLKKEQRICIRCNEPTEKQHGRKLGLCDACDNSRNMGTCLMCKGRCRCGARRACIALLSLWRLPACAHASGTSRIRHGRGVSRVLADCWVLCVCERLTAQTRARGGRLLLRKRVPAMPSPANSKQLRA